MTKRFQHNGKKYRACFFYVLEREYRNSHREGKTHVYLESEDGYGKDLFLSVYYRPERTLDDHMGNTPCGYYVNITLPDGKRKRVYIY